MPKTEFGCKSYGQNKIGGQNSGNFRKDCEIRKQFAILAKFANTSQSVRKLSEFGNAIANLAMVLRSWQWCCEVGKVANFAS